MWRELANTPIRPELGTSKIKQILSAIHNLGLVYWFGCPAAEIQQDREKGFIFLQLANEFEYVPTRYFLGKQLLSGDVIEKDVALGSEYLQQAIFCEPPWSDEYSDDAVKALHAAGLSFERQTDFDSQCLHIGGAYFKGPTLEFDALAYKSDWEGRSATTSENLGWLGAGFRGTEQVLKEAVPLALLGAAMYYSAKVSAQSQSNAGYSSAMAAGFAGSYRDRSVTGDAQGNSRRPFDFRPTAPVRSPGVGFSNMGNPGIPTVNSFPSQSRSSPQISISTRSAGIQTCRSDFECGLGRACVRPQQGLSLEGICGTIVDEFGLRDFSEIGPAVGPRRVSSCSFTTDCPVGFRCEKTSGSLHGVCVK